MTPEIELPPRPEWKTPKSVADREEVAKCLGMTVREALPSSGYRIAWLKNRDGQLRQLFDCLEGSGIPMGADTWAHRAMLHIRRLEAERLSARRVLMDFAEGRLPDIQRMKDDFDHHRLMHSKHLPPMEIRCDVCGWPGARPIGTGHAACEDCLPTPEGGPQ